VGSAHKASHGVDWLINEIGSAGIPSIVACDREPNDIVRKVASAFRARLFIPKRAVDRPEEGDGGAVRDNKSA